MGKVTVLKAPQAECCATCSNWGLAAYYHHPDGIGDDEPFCTVNLVSLQPLVEKYGGKRITCNFWRLEAIETDSIETYHALVMGRHG